MESVAAVFTSLPPAKEACAELRPLGIPNDKISLLTPRTSEAERDAELAAVPAVEAEQPGMGKALGAAVGGAVGLASGMGAAGAVASALVPGIGPVLAVGLAGAAVLGTIGAATGGAIERALSDGIPADELFVYEDALRKGRTVVIVMAENSRQAEAVRGALEHGGAESIDSARENWWLGLRDVEKEKYELDGRNFDEDERYFRCGFEAALHSENRDKSYEACHARLGERHPGMHDREPFRRGYERGRAYLETIKARRN